MTNKSLSFIILISLATASEFEWKADFRYRLETDKSDSLLKGKASTIHYARSRISLKFINGPVSALAQLQDSRYFGDKMNFSGKPAYSGNYDTFYFHQLFFKINHLLKQNWAVKIGRFELPLGSERLFSKNNWNNYGRSFDGLQSITRNRFGEINLFHLIIEEYFIDKKQDDGFDKKLTGLYFSSAFQLFRRISIPAFDIYYYSYQYDYKYIVEKTSHFDRRSLGTRINFNIFSHIIEWESGIQTGRIEDQYRIGIFGKSQKIDAYFSVLNVYITLQTIPVINKLSVGKEYFSGDIPDNDILEGFANPWGEEHKYHGYIDKFTNFKDNYQSGMDEWNVKTEFSLPGNFMLNIHYHDFKDGVKSDPLGTELDIIFSNKLGFGGILQQGFARYWEEDGDRIDYGWLMLTFTL